MLSSDTETPSDICDGAGLSSSLEKVFFGTFHARMYLNSDLFGINCATGMSALMRKELLDNKGGFDAFGCYLAEDFFFAQAVQASSGLQLCNTMYKQSQSTLFCTNTIAATSPIVHLLIQDQNYKLAVSHQPANQNPAESSVVSFQNRMSRCVVAIRRGYRTLLSDTRANRSGSKAESDIHCPPN